MMKSLFFLSFVVFLTVVAQAQLKVYSDGDVGIGATNPDSKFCINTDGYSGALAFFNNTNGANSPRTLQIKQKPEGEGWVYSLLVGVDQGTGGGPLVGVYGSAYRSSYKNNKTFGVYGVTGNGLSGYNYGVFGELLGDGNGTAVCGTTGNLGLISGKYAGYFSGNVKITDTLWVNTTPYISDAALKKDVRNLEGNIIPRLQQLKGVKYKLMHPTELPNFSLSQSDTISLESLQLDINSPKYTADRIGLIAQDLQKVFPELVSKNNEGYLGVHYIGMIPILVEAIKEQQQIIDTLTHRINNLSPETYKLKSESTSVSDDVTLQSSLSQNKPNPFNQETIIEFFISSESKNAVLYIYDMQGTQIKSYNIQERGNSSVTIHGSEFNPGMYLYTLIVDGNEVDTKRMILTN